MVKESAGLKELKGNRKFTSKLNKREPRVRLAKNQAIIDFETSEKEYLISVTQDEDLGLVKSEFLGEDFDSGANIIETSEFDGDKAIILIQANPSIKENKRKLLELKDEKSLKREYTVNSGEKASPNWTKQELIDAILEEIYD